VRHAQLTDVHRPEGNFCVEHGKAHKPVIVTNCNLHMRYIDREDKIADSHLVNWRMWRWTKKLFFYL
jgi:desulfoferrodoxin (superoxide reductase-like protein)